MLCGTATGIIAIIFGGIAASVFDKKGNSGAGCLFALLAFPPGLAAAACWIIGTVRFAKWIWNG
jgi:hypothetical protein